MLSHRCDVVAAATQELGFIGSALREVLTRDPALAQHLASPNSVVQEGVLRELSSLAVPVDIVAWNDAGSDGPQEDGHGQQVTHPATLGRHPAPHRQRGEHPMNSPRG